MQRLTLQRHSGVELKKSKLCSLARKYFSIPKQYRKYYPDVSDLVKELKLGDVPPALGGLKRKGGMKKDVRVKRRKVGRPSKDEEPVGSVPGTPSILTYFTAKSGL